ncbi:gelsolin-like protein 2 isoform X2 [Mercenaria mercenaria]|uniref:gelsolin-like protein 2 isoform X2 n=1 Tax=Mercenaria mercenaria TaxID=6596 RepID=UPI00234F39C8|nr:gelsolin-like protein 2 isoform X2 [Mercenaria mercenaria]
MVQTYVLFMYCLAEASVLGEPGWKNAGTQPGLQIWKIVNFTVTEWPKEDYGKFYNGDSYIILNSYREGTSAEHLKYDVHYWIGSKSSKDEYDAAAYKTVELKTFLGNGAVQHREIQGSESELFRSYFEELVTMEGGAESGVRHAEPIKYRKKLLQVSGMGADPSITEVPLSKDSLNSDDVFILDAGTTLWQYNGIGASSFEKAWSMEYLLQIEQQRGGHIKSVVVDEHTIREDDEFYKVLEDDESGSEEEDVKY